MKIYRVTEALQELSLTGQKPFVLIAPMNPKKKRNIFFLTVYRRNKNVGRWESTKRPQRVEFVIAKNKQFLASAEYCSC